MTIEELRRVCRDTPTVDLWHFAHFMKFKARARMAREKGWAVADNYDEEAEKALRDLERDKEETGE